MYSQAVVVANKNLEPEKREILDQMLFRFNSVMASATNKYVLLNALMKG